MVRQRRYGRKKRAGTRQMVSIAVLFVVSFLIYTNTVSGATSMSNASTSSAVDPLVRTGLLVPLYTAPTDQTWTTLESAAKAYPNVPVIVVFNPYPYYVYNSQYVSGVQGLEAAGITPAGYISTQYGSVSISTVEQEMSEYHTWYGVRAFFLDEANNTVAGAAYYGALQQYADSVFGTGTIIITNQGAPTPSVYIGKTSILVVYEDSGTPTLSGLSNAGAPKSDFAMIAYNVPWNGATQTWLSSAEPSLGWVYLTDASCSGSVCNPYSVLPSYLTNEMQALETYDTA